MKVGSSLDSQIWYEPYHANEFKLFMKTDLFKSFLMNECKVCNVFWFLVLINPVLVTSKKLMEHLYPEMSVRKCEYLFVFSLCLTDSPKTTQKCKNAPKMQKQPKIAKNGKNLKRCKSES